MLIRTTCPDCGVIDMPNDRFALLFDHTRYVFQCPSCGSGVAKRTDARIVAALKQAGVVTMPAPGDEVDGVGAIREALVQIAAPPLTEDDLLDFVQNIDAEIEALLSNG